MNNQGTHGLSRREWIRASAAVPLLAREPQRQGDAGGLDGSRLPFSRFGSYWAVSKRWPWGATDAIPGGAWYIRLLADDPTPNELFRVEMQVRGSKISFEPRLTPSKLTLSAGSEATAGFVIAETDVLRVRGQGCSLRLYGIKGSYGYAIERNARTWEVMADVATPRVQVLSLRGELKVAAPWLDENQKASCLSITIDLVPDSSGVFECALQYYDAVPRRTGRQISFDDAERNVQAEFQGWTGALQAVSPEYTDARNVAAYVLWSSVVAPRGLYRAPVLWCSKSWMNRIWSWDHCFVAVGLAPAFHDLAWQQFCLFRDMQDPDSGMCADWFSNVRKSWLCTKPPVHGWALSHLLQAMPGAVTRERLREIYEPLRKWTNFWLTERNLEGDGLPCILNPNESFDNTTANTLGGPVKAPEIAAYLILQLETLANVAGRLGYDKDAREWQSRSRTLLDALLRVLWDAGAGKFRALRVGDHQSADGDCIYSYVPLVLGRLLPAAVTEAMVRALSEPGRFLTPYGLSTESLRSPRYNGNSYVKGPVWAPPNVFITEGLDALGSRELAARIRRSFLNVCAKEGMSEHFDARTGAAQGDPGYNWTAAMFLHFAKQESAV